MPLTNALPGFNDPSPGAALTSEVSMGKCSLLHSRPCALDNWATLMQCSGDLAMWMEARSGSSAAFLTSASWDALGVSLMVAAICFMVLRGTGRVKEAPAQHGEWKKERETEELRPEACLPSLCVQAELSNQPSLASLLDDHDLKTSPLSP